jgi:hypothetical protein
MTRQNLHSAFVIAWMEQIVQPLAPAQMVQTFAAAFAAMWGRAQRTLGEVTLSAITDRVLHNAKESFPILSSLAVEPTGLGTGDLGSRADTIPREQLWEAIQFVLIEFLTVLGTLTTEILTEALHAELTAMESKLHIVDPAAEDAKS